MPDHPTRFLDPQRLAERAGELAESFQQATPFPHTVVTDLISGPAIQQIADEAAAMSAAGLAHPFDNAYQKKLGVGDETNWQDGTRQLMHELNSGVFLDFLQTLTGIDGLLPDPWFHGGGIHEVRAGGKLDVHADFSHHPSLPLWRRLNVIVYLNPDWQPDWGGQIELWATDMSRAERTVEPTLGTMLIFETTSTSFHGHPDPLRCPDDRARRSLALYYYTVDETVGVDATDRADHPTLWQRRPGEQARSWRDWVPPVVADAVRRRRS